jgi:hypothetical protein
MIDAVEGSFPAAMSAATIPPAAARNKPPAPKTIIERSVSSLHAFIFHIE